MTSVRLQLLRRQLLSSALTPSLQYEATAFRLHALTETMRLLAPMVVRLIRHLHHDPPPQKKVLGITLRIPSSQNAKEQKTSLLSLLTMLNYSPETT